MIDKKLLLCVSGVNVKEKGVLVKADLGRHFEIDGAGHKILAVDLIKGEFALVSVVNHGFELI